MLIFKKFLLGSFFALLFLNSCCGKFEDKKKSSKNSQEISDENETPSQIGEWKNPELLYAAIIEANLVNQDSLILTKDTLTVKTTCWVDGKDPKSAVRNTVEVVTPITYGEDSTLKVAKEVMKKELFKDQGIDYSCSARISAGIYKFEVDDNQLYWDNVLYQRVSN
jgi:hypothetical protein